MIVFAFCDGASGNRERFALPGIRAAAESDSMIIEVDTDSIFAGYNEVLDALRDRDDLEALVLLHDDVELRESASAFGARVRERLADESVAVIGTIGARGIRSLCWWEHELFGRVRESRAFVDHGGGVHEVDAVDGLLMVLSPWAVRNLRFDDDRFHGFHGYDLDICFQARAAGRRVVVDEIDVFHHTAGGFNDPLGFGEADKLWREKWSAAGFDVMSNAERWGREDAA